MRKILKGIIASALTLGMILPIMPITIANAAPTKITVTSADVDKDGIIGITGREVEDFIYKTYETYIGPTGIAKGQVPLILDFGGLSITGGFGIRVPDVEIANANITLVNDKSGGTDIHTSYTTYPNIYNTVDYSVQILESNVTISGCTIRADYKDKIQNVVVASNKTLSNINIHDNIFYLGTNKDYDANIRQDPESGTGITVGQLDINNLNITKNKFYGYRSKNPLIIYGTNKVAKDVNFSGNEIYGTYISGPYMLDVNGLNMKDNLIYGTYINRTNSKYGEPGVILESCDGVLNITNNSFKNCKYALCIYSGTQSPYFANNKIEYATTTPVHVVREGVINASGIFGKYDQVNLSFDYQQVRSDTNLYSGVNNFIDYFYKATTSTYPTLTVPNNSGSTSATTGTMNLTANPSYALGDVSGLKAAATFTNAPTGSYVDVVSSPTFDQRTAGGPFTVTFTLKDAAGNVLKDAAGNNLTMTRTVNVTATSTFPTLTVPNNSGSTSATTGTMNVTANPSYALGDVSGLRAAATFTNAPTGSYVDVVSSPTFDQRTAGGPFTVTFTLKDAAGNILKDVAGNNLTMTRTVNVTSSSTPGTPGTITVPNPNQTTYVNYGAPFDPLAGVYGTNLNGTIVPVSYTITGPSGTTVPSVNTTIPGEYKITYTFVDTNGVTRSLVRTVYVYPSGSQYPNYYYNYSSTTPSTDVKTISDPFVYVGTFVAPPTTTTETTTTKKDKTKKNAVINAKDRTLKVGDKFIFMEGVTAADNGGKGKDLTDKVTMTGTINTLKPGAYKMTYKVTGANGKTVSKVITITVK